MQEPPAPPPMPAPPAQYSPASVPAAIATNTMAVVSLATGIASWFVLPLVGGVVAVITGHLAKKEIRQTGEQGDGLATVGLVLGYLHLAVVALVVLVLILVFGAVIAAFLSSRGLATP
ncbi:MAG TPA: DUF4190 domain-containing protein [Candidatus Dormibacteraeota bacterium]|nr:DUF4190 domain-containing protein [Candidatus Dormibacteraeota bacterium]